MQIASTTAIALGGLLTATSSGVLFGPPEDHNDDQVLADVQNVLDEKEPIEDTSNPNISDVEVDEGEVHAETVFGDDVLIELPGEPVDDPRRVDDLSLEAGGDAYSTLVEHLEDGSFRNLLHIESERAPENFEFEFPADLELHKESDGSVTISNEEGDSIGFLDHPWAVDADGKKVPVEYAIQGQTLTKVVHHGTTTAYPVVADPVWIPALKVVAAMTRHATTQASARGVSQHMINQAIQNGTRTAGYNNTSVFTQGSGASKIRVIVNNSNGNIVTVTRG